MSHHRSHRISREEIRAVYRQGEEAVIALVEGLLDRIERLETRVGQLESQLQKTSRNSHKPPSSDGFKKRTKSQRQKSTRPSGGQPNHPGKTLEWRERVDDIVVHPVTECCACRCSLSDIQATLSQARQVHDLPPLSMQVIEHQVEAKICPDCGCLNQAQFPSHVSASVQYGPRLKGLLVYLMDGQLLPSNRVHQFLSEVYGAELSEGSLYYNRSDCYERLAPIEAQIKQGLIASSVTNFDETGFRITGKGHWLHTACNAQLTYYFVHPKRGRVAMNEMGILPTFDGICVHDGLISYRHYEVEHALCNAHHLRELQAIVEQGTQPWAEKMIELLCQMNRSVKHAKKHGAQCLDARRVGQFIGRYVTLLASGLRMNRPPPIDPQAPKKKGRAKQSPAKNLLDRLNQYQDQVLRFMMDFRVPFDNNQAERDLRMMKLKQKISGTFRSFSGAQEFCRIRGYISTLRKQDIGVLDALTQLFAGEPVIPSLHS